MQMEMRLGFIEQPRVVEGGNWRSYLAVMRHVNRGFEMDQRPQNYDVTETCLLYTSPSPRDS